MLFLILAQPTSFEPFLLASLIKVVFNFGATFSKGCFLKVVYFATLLQKVCLR
uniref:Uncharacterized protein n=1 Tax=viral metagenome TaxID=1070528 RepID=A0A6C0IJY1_9ZZZZ